jgi:hypothetical protein
MKSKFKYGLSIVLLFFLILSGIFFSAFLAQYFESGTNFFENLAMVLKGRCSGSLDLSGSGTGTCFIKAKVLTSGCTGKAYRVSEDSCFGPAKCQGTIGYEHFQAACGWSVSSGSHKYVLCIDGKQKDSKSITC